MDSKLNSKRSSQYDFKELCQVFPDLEPFVFDNKQNHLTIDFANPKAVKALNRALLLSNFNIKYWDFPDTNLCPPIPGRLMYIDAISDLLLDSNIEKNIHVLDIGTGATCIYPLLGYSKYQWNFTATDVDKTSLKNAQVIINKNKLNSCISLRFQKDASHVFNGIIQPEDLFSVSMCNPPFYKSENEANQATKRKLKGLGKLEKEVTRNFSGNSNELWYPGGEKAFLHNYLYQSSLYKSNCFWFTTLVSQKEHIKSMKTSLKKLNANKIKVLDISLGNKKVRVVAWTFLTQAEQNSWSR
ncbi:23S rRNA (adenine(1618)-N(6))-methyltransferase RlmF [Corallibacter sp.]|uniref:23S rRNA (adenine(1618)-N(6))-methyltransferase RlmF n=1 Tax=Corallibacter sp. TaxID=2038084 RepID=UPI003AB36F92